MITFTDAHALQQLIERALTNLERHCEFTLAVGLTESPLVVKALTDLRTALRLANQITEV